MKFIRLTEELTPSFKNFCVKHRGTVDESFINDEDLGAFVANDENPTILGMVNDSIVAAVSIMITKPNTKARFRIFHTETNEMDDYRKLLENILPFTEGLETLNIFADESHNALFEVLKVLDFELERYIYVMTRVDDGSPIELDLPEGYSVEVMNDETDSEDYLHIRNSAFDGLIGSSPQNLEQVKELQKQHFHWKNGTVFVKHNGVRIGFVKMNYEIENGVPTASVAPIAVLPTHQGKGLGRQLLLAGLKFAQQQNVPNCYLCVNASNARAADLYKKEGFVEDKVVLSWNFFLDKNGM